jgi:hypothetical protein
MGEQARLDDRVGDQHWEVGKVLGDERVVDRDLLAIQPARIVPGQGSFTAGTGEGKRDPGKGDIGRILVRYFRRSVHAYSSASCDLARRQTEAVGMEPAGRLSVVSVTPQRADAGRRALPDSEPQPRITFEVAGAHAGKNLDAPQRPRLVWPVPARD